MRPKNFDKKLSLQKTTVSNLNQILAGNVPEVDQIRLTNAYRTCICAATDNCTVSRCYTQCPSIGAPCMAC